MRSAAIPGSMAEKKVINNIYDRGELLYEEEIPESLRPPKILSGQKWSIFEMIGRFFELFLALYGGLLLVYGDLSVPSNVDHHDLFLGRIHCSLLSSRDPRSSSIPFMPSDTAVLKWYRHVLLTNGDVERTPRLYLQGLDRPHQSKEHNDHIQGGKVRKTDRNDNFPEKGREDQDIWT